MKKEILFLRDPHDKLKEFFLDKLSPDHFNLYFSPDNPEEIIDRIDCIVGWRPELELLRKASNLQVFINPGTGVQHLMGEISSYFKENGIILINGHGNSYFTATHAVAMYHALTNRVILHHNWMTEGVWRRGDNFAKSYPIRHKTVGLLGYGAINQKVHRFLSGYNIQFSILKREWKENETPDDVNISKLYSVDSLHDFIREVDVLIIALPFTKETEDMIGKKELELLGNNGMVINVGRGGIINQKDLYDALKEKIIFGAGIDVWYNYQPEENDGKKYPYEYPFHELDNIVLSPHRAASPFDDIERWEEVITNLEKLADGKTDFINRVNMNTGY